MGILSSINKAISTPLGGVVTDLVGTGVNALLNKSSAKDQMKFQEKMSNTAYQRAMADMRKAGLNPILAARLGGASTPGGAGWSVNFPSLASGASSGADVKKKEVESEKIIEEKNKVRQEIENLKSQRAKTETERVLVALQQNLVQAQTRTEQNRIVESWWTAQSAEQQNKIIKRLAQESEIIAKILQDSEGMETVRILKWIFGGTQVKGVGVGSQN